MKNNSNRRPQRGNNTQRGNNAQRGNRRPQRPHREGLNLFKIFREGAAASLNSAKTLKSWIGSAASATLNGAKTFSGWVGSFQWGAGVAATLNGAKTFSGWVGSFQWSKGVERTAIALKLKQPPRRPQTWKETGAQGFAAILKQLGAVLLALGGGLKLILTVGFKTKLGIICVFLLILGVFIWFQTRHKKDKSRLAAAGLALLFLGGLGLALASQHYAAQAVPLYLKFFKLFKK